jgi:hypothetical protein
MKKFTGTQGEWEICNVEIKGSTEEHLVIYSEGRKLSNDKKYPFEMVCVISPMSRLNEEDKINAKLIAAAPELLDALLDLENDNNSIPKSIWDKIQNAINKALD